MHAAYIRQSGSKLCPRYHPIQALSGPHVPPSCGIEETNLAAYGDVKICNFARRGVLGSFSTLIIRWHMTRIKTASVVLCLHIRVSTKRGPQNARACVYIYTHIFIYRDTCRIMILATGAK